MLSSDSRVPCQWETFQRFRRRFESAVNWRALGVVLAVGPEERRQNFHGTDGRECELCLRPCEVGMLVYKVSEDDGGQSESKDEEIVVYGEKTFQN